MNHLRWRRPVAISAALLTFTAVTCSSAASPVDATLIVPLETLTPVTTPSPTPSTPTSTASPVPASQATAQAGDCRLLLEVARTSEERARGLMERSSLPQDWGMFFVYEEEGLLRFWMRDTLIPLDILFLDSMGSVVDVQTMVPEPGVAPELLRTYTSAAPARYALEVNAGVAAACGVEVGSQVALDEGLGFGRGPPVHSLVG